MIYCLQEVHAKNYLDIEKLSLINGWLVPLHKEESNFLNSSL